MDWTGRCFLLHEMMNDIAVPQSPQSPSEFRDCIIPCFSDFYRDRSPEYRVSIGGESGGQDAV